MASTSDFLEPGSSDSESEVVERIDQEPSPPPPKKKKCTGAAKYLTKFKSEWKKEFPFVTSVAGDSHR